MKSFCTILFNILSIWIRLKLIWQYWRTCCFGKGWGNTETPFKRFTNHNALGQLTNHNTFRFSESGRSSNPELIGTCVPGCGERYCNNVNYVKKNWFSNHQAWEHVLVHPQKQNQDFVKEHNRTPLNNIEFPLHYAFWNNEIKSCKIGLIYFNIIFFFFFFVVVDHILVTVHVFVLYHIMINIVENKTMQP